MYIMYAQLVTYILNPRTIESLRGYIGQLIISSYNYSPDFLRLWFFSNKVTINLYLFHRLMKNWIEAISA